MRRRTRMLIFAAVFCVAALHAQNVGYVVDNAGGRVLVVNLATQNVEASIPSGSQASELFIQPGNQTAFVSNQGENNVALLDLTNKLRLAAIPTGQGPGSLIATPDGRFLYVANDTSNDVTVIDVMARQAVATIPVGATPVQVNMSRDGRYAYVVNKDETPAGTISVIDTNRNVVVKTLPVGVSPNQFAILPNLNTAYVVNTGSNSVSLFDLSLNQVTGEVAVGQEPVSVAFSSDSKRLYVVNRASNNVSVVDTQQNQEIAKIPAGTEPVAMAVTFDSKFGFVSNSGSGSVTLLDLTNNTNELDIAVGSQPFSLMLDPDENFLFVTNLGSGSVSVIDVNADKVAKTIPTGGVPVQFTLLNAPTLLELAPNPALSNSTLTLSGEAFLPTSVVRFVTASPPRTLTPPVTFLDSQGLQVAVPSFQGSAIVDVLNPDGNSSERITLQTGLAAPSVFAGGVVEAAGFAKAPSPISGNAIVAIFGNFPGLGDGTATSFPLPRNLANAQVTFNGVPASIFGASSAAQQINALAPVRLLAHQAVRVAVTIGGQTSAAETVNVAPTSPGIFMISADGAGAFLHPDYSLVTPENPARRDGNDTIAMFVTGLGNTAPPPIDGEGAPFDVFSYATAEPAVTVAGVQATVQFSGLTPGTSGLYQINFDVPAAAPAGNEVQVQFTIGGRASNTVLLAVK